MKITLSNPLLRLANSYLIDSPLASNLTYAWNWGSLLGVNLVVMILSGVTLAMHYTANTESAFASVEHIMRDVHLGWLLRLVHANGATVFFILVYLHIGRGLFFGSYRAPRGLLWAIGVILFITMMGIAFLGYVLPWGHMSFWGATVITNLLSAIPWVGGSLVELIWGSFSVAYPAMHQSASPISLLALLLLIHQTTACVTLGELFMGNPLLIYYPN